MAGEVKLSAVDIKKLWYCATTEITADLTGTALYALINDTDTKEVENVHQDTWTLDEAAPSQNSYRNQLTGSVYRMDAKDMGAVTMNFTLGRYDYVAKADLMGGTGTATSWKRARGATDIKKALIALTEDDQYVVFPCASISARESYTDKAVGIAVVGTMLEPENTAILPEYWFDKSVVVAQGS